MKRTVKIRNKPVNLTRESDLGSNSRGQHPLAHRHVLHGLFKWLSHLFCLSITWQHNTKLPELKICISFPLQWIYLSSRCCVEFPVIARCFDLKRWLKRAPITPFLQGRLLFCKSSSYNLWDSLKTPGSKMKCPEHYSLKKYWLKNALSGL